MQDLQLLSQGLKLIGEVVCSLQAQVERLEYFCVSGQRVLDTPPPSEVHDCKSESEDSAADYCNDSSTYTNNEHVDGVSSVEFHPSTGIASMDRATFLSVHARRSNPYLPVTT